MLSTDLRSLLLINANTTTFGPSKGERVHHTSSYLLSPQWSRTILFHLENACFLSSLILNTGSSAENREGKEFTDLPQSSLTPGQMYLLSLSVLPQHQAIERLGKRTWNRGRWHLEGTNGKFNILGKFSERDSEKWKYQEDSTGSGAWENFKLPRKEAGNGMRQEMGTGQGTS